MEGWKEITCKVCKDIKEGKRREVREWEIEGETERRREGGKKRAPRGSERAEQGRGGDKHL